MLKQHYDQRVVATLALAHGYQVPVGVAKTEGKKVIGWTEKPTLPIRVGIGIMAFQTNIFEDYGSHFKKKSEFDIMGDLVPYLLERKELIGGYSTNAFWYDVGSMERYEKLNNSLVEKNLSILFSDKKSLDVHTK